MLQENCVGSSTAPREARQQLYQAAARASATRQFGESFDETTARFDRTADLQRASSAELDAIGGVQAGIESLIRLSNEIRGTGRGGRRTTIGGIVGRVIAENGAVESGANAILQGMGIGRNITSTINSIIPGNVDKAFATACRVFNLVRSGSFFGGVVNDALPDFLQLEHDVGTAPPLTKDDVNGKFEGCFASPYAVDLIQRAPKFKYQFVVEFEWSSAIDQRFMGQPTYIAFVVKNTTRPNVRYDYEDINMYNFRTKAIKRMEYEPMTMRFHDDDENNAMRFVNRYYRSMSPIGNYPKGPDKTSKDATTGANVNMSQELQEEGMAFTPGAFACQQYSSSIGPILGLGEGSQDDTRQPLKRITIYHVFDQGRRMNVYHMYNPRVTELTLDELDHSIGTEGTEVALTFNYDALTMITSASFNPNSADRYDIKGLELQAGAQFPLRYVDHPNNAASKQEGLVDAFCPPGQGTGSFSAEGVVGRVGNSLSSGEISGFGTPILQTAGGALPASTQTLARAARANPFQLPAPGDLGRQLSSIADGGSGQIANFSETTISNFRNSAALERVSADLERVAEARAAGLTEVLVDGAMKPLAEADQIYYARQLKHTILEDRGNIDAVTLRQIDAAAGVVV